MFHANMYNIVDTSGTIAPKSTKSESFDLRSILVGLFWVAQGVYRLDYGVDDRRIGVIFRAEARYFSSPQSRGLWCPPSFLFNGYRELSSLGVKGPGREADGRIMRIH
jgi:hypothetical protein